MDTAAACTSVQEASPSPGVRLALRYDPRPRPGADDAARVYDALLEHARQAEERGIELVWISERPFVRGARIPAALPLCAMLAASTSRIRIGVGPLALPLYHPLRVAEDAATLDGISGGRIELALGLGGTDQAFVGFGVSPRSRGDRLEEGIALVRAAWTGEPVHLDGKHHTVSGVTVSPRPVQRPAPPLWVGAAADAAVRRAARLGTGLLATEPAAIGSFLIARRAMGAAAAPARVALECEAAAVLGPAGRDAAVRLAAMTAGAAILDLVVAAEPAGEDGWIDFRALDALLALRESLLARA